MSRNTPPAKRRTAKRPGTAGKPAANSRPPAATTPTARSTTSTAKIALAWAFVGLPLAWGVVMTVRSALALFA